MACGAAIINCVVKIIKINQEYNSKMKSFDKHWEEIRKDIKADKEKFLWGDKMTDWQYIGLLIQLSCILYVLCDIRRAILDVIQKIDDKK